MTPELADALQGALCRLLSTVTYEHDEQERLAVEVVALVLAAQHAPDVGTFELRADEVFAAHEELFEAAQGGDAGV